MKKCLIDSSSAILLYKSGLLRILISTFDVRVGSVVYEELTHSGYPGCDQFKKFFREKQLENRKKQVGDISENLMVSAGLDPGERQTILLFHKVLTDFVIIDDGAAVRCCRKLRIPHINALLVPRILKISGKISREACQRKMERLMEIGRYGPNVIDFARKCDGSRLLFFVSEK